MPHIRNLISQAQFEFMVPTIHLLMKKKFAPDIITYNFTRLKVVFYRGMVLIERLEPETASRTEKIYHSAEDFFNEYMFSSSSRKTYTIGQLFQLTIDKLFK